MHPHADLMKKLKAAALKPLQFDRLYGAFPGQLIKSDAGKAVARSGSPESPTRKRGNHQ